MSAAPKATCIKCAPKKVALVDRLPPLTRELAGVENGREYSSITWYKLRCPECGTCKNLRCLALVEEKKSTDGAPMTTQPRKIAKDKKSSQPKTSSQRAGQQRKDRRNRRSSRSGN